MVSTHLESISQVGSFYPGTGENNKYWKPPRCYDILSYLYHHLASSQESTSSLSFGHIDIRIGMSLLRILPAKQKASSSYSPSYPKEEYEIRTPKVSFFWAMAAKSWIFRIQADPGRDHAIVIVLLPINTISGVLNKPINVLGVAGECSPIYIYTYTHK